MTTCMSMAKEAGMDEEELFRAVTSAPAKILGKEGEWGSLQVGKTADLAVFDYSNESFDLTDKAGNRLSSENAVFEIKNGFLTMTSKDLDHARVFLHRAFPFDLLWQYISVLDIDQNELGVGTVHAIHRGRRKVQLVATGVC